MDDQTITLIVLAAAVALFIWNRLPVGVVALGAALALYLTGVIDATQAVAGFGEPTVIFIASLFVVSDALDATGVTAYVGQRLVESAGGRARKLELSLLGLVAALAAIITVNGAVAALIPITVMVALRLRTSPSRLLMPLAFVAHAGSMLALTGTPVNILVSQAAGETGAGRFGFFEFALAGIPLLAGALLITSMFGRRLVPERTPRSLAPDLSGYARTLIEHYSLDRGTLALHQVPEGLFSTRSGVAELLVPPRSELIGDIVFPGMVSEDGSLVILAVQRAGRDQGPQPTALAAGDTLLVEGAWESIEQRDREAQLMAVQDPDTVRRQVVPLGKGSWRVLLITAAMVVLLITNLVPPAIAGLLAALAIVATRAVSSEQAYRAINWPTVVLIAGMIPVSNAIKDTGAAEQIAHQLVDLIGGAGPHLLLLGLFAITVLFGQAISNTATALVMIPIAISAAAELHVSPRPLLMGVAVAAAASFLTPIATPANMMVMGPGGYRFGDYWRLGLPMLALFGVVSVLAVPTIWPF